MKGDTSSYRLDVDTRLVEESVLLACESCSPSEKRLFRSQRDVIYEEKNDELRESRFRSIHWRWFVRLRLTEALWDCLQEVPVLAGSTSRCLVLSAPSVRDEGADLHENRRPENAPAQAKPVLVLKLLPRTLLHRDPLVPFLRHELLHVADMLDPDFGYEKTLSLPSFDPMYQKLIRERYRVLWDTTIDGRLWANRALPQKVEEMRRSEFMQAFPMLQSSAEDCFRRFFRGPRPPHPELVRFATQPGCEES